MVIEVRIDSTHDRARRIYDGHCHPFSLKRSRGGTHVPRRRPCRASCLRSKLGHPPERGVPLSSTVPIDTHSEQTSTSNQVRADRARRHSRPRLEPAREPRTTTNPFSLADMASRRGAASEAQTFSTVSTCRHGLPCDERIRAHRLHRHRRRAQRAMVGAVMGFQLIATSERPGFKIRSMNLPGSYFTVQLVTTKTGSPTGSTNMLSASTTSRCAFQTGLRWSLQSGGALR